MKKSLAIVCALALGSALSFAQAAGGGKPENQTPSASSSQTPASSDTATSTRKHSKSHKSKKARKSAGDATAPASTASPK